MKFQYILLTFFGLVAVAAVLVFSLMPEEADPALRGVAGKATIWGTFPHNEAITKMVTDFNAAYKDIFLIEYVFHDPKDFDTDIVEALAAGRGPDILLLPDDLIMRHADKIEPFSYQAVPADQFRAAYVQSAEIYLRPDGVLALPFAIDPMVMYWNRDLFNNASIATPPKYWDELLLLSPKLTKRDQKTFEITESALPFGEYANVDHAKEILAMLFLQVGNPIIAFEGSKPLTKLHVENAGGAPAPGEDVTSALRFFMDFSNPQKPNYTWNRARPNSLDAFINGELAIDLDFASAHQRIKLKNPHLNYAVAQVPLPRGTKAEITFARVYGLAVLKSSKNKQTAFVAATRLLTDRTPAEQFASGLGLPPVLRSSLSQRPTDASLAVFYDAALRGRTWLDPKPGESNKAFQDMIETVSSGRGDPKTALAGLHTDLTALLAAYQ